MKKYLKLIVCVLSVMMVACERNDPQTSGSSSSGSSSKEAKYLRVTPTDLTFVGFYMQSKYIKVESNTDWDIEIKNKDMFQTVSPRYRGSGNGQISVTVPEISSNKQSTFTTQKGEIIISCKDENRRTISYTVECERKKSY